MSAHQGGRQRHTGDVQKPINLNKGHKQLAAGLDQQV